MSHVTKIFSLVLLATASGCSVFSSQSLNVVEDPQVEPMEPFPIAPHLFSLNGEFSSVDVAELKPGQKVQVLTKIYPNSPSQLVFSDDIIAGVVHNVSDSHLVLSNVVQVTYAVSQDTGTMLSRIPYVSRLFKNTAMGATATHIPGAVTLPRSDVVAASVLTDQAYQSLSNGEPPRIGIDFDVVEDDSVQQPQQLGASSLTNF